MIFRLKWGYFGAEKNVCPLETSIQILFLTDLIIPADGQIKLDIFRHRNFALWSMGTKVMPVLVKTSKILSYFSSKPQNEDFSAIFHKNFGYHGPNWTFLCLNISTFSCPSAGNN